MPRTATADVSPALVRFAWTALFAGTALVTLLLIGGCADDTYGPDPDSRRGAAGMQADPANEGLQQSDPDTAGLAQPDATDGTTGGGLD